MGAQVPAEYQQLYSDLKAALDEYGTYLSSRTGPSYPIIFGAELLPANGNRGSDLLAPQAMQGVTLDLDRFQEIGIQGVTIAIGFPLYTPTFPNYHDYVQFYKNVVQEVRKHNMKLDIESSILFANTQFSKVSFNYAGLSFSDFETQRQQSISTIVRDLQPDYLNLGAEPDTEYKLTGYTELTSPAQYTAYMNFLLAGLNRGNTKVGAGIGTWGNIAYAQSLAANTNLDFISMHVYPIVGQASLQQIFAIGNIAKQSGKRLVLDEAWLYKVDTLQTTSIAANAEIFQRDAYSFWAPLDQEFLARIVKSAQLEGIDYISPFWSTYFFGYIDYDPTTAGLSYADSFVMVNKIAAQNMLSDSFTSTGTFYGQLAQGNSSVTSSQTTGGTSMTTASTIKEGLRIPGFPLESIILGIAVGLVALALLRRRR
jgi:hypothetical protein